jgi:2-dehydropantoate 2-reductase
VADVWVLCRRDEHARALAEDGLRVTGRADFTARLDATTDPAELPGVDLAIVATKATELDAAAARLEGRIPGAILMTVQNGLGAEEIVRRHGDWRLLSAVTFMSGTRHSDTQVEYVLDTETWLGPYGDTPPELAEETARLIVSSGLRARAFADLRPASRR